MGLDTNIRAKEEEGKKNFNSVHATRVRASTQTNFKVLGILLGLVAALTVGFCYLFSFTLNFIRNYHRNGERLRDVMKGRLYEQQRQRQRDTYY